MHQKYVVFRNCYQGDMECQNALLQFKYNQIKFFFYYLKKVIAMSCVRQLYMNLVEGIL